MRIPPSVTFPFPLLSLALTLSAGAADDSLVRNSEARSAEEELAALHVPEGFEIQLFAAEPQINKPINLALDARGRLWVSSTAEYPYAAAKERWSDPQGTRVDGSRDAIKILEDTDGDGRADKVSDFADGLNIPTGVLPWHKPEHRDGCIAWSIPNIWYFADTTGDGKADHREVLFGPLGYERDTHGMCSSFRMGDDGWVYATHGFNNTSKLKAKDGTEIELHSGNVFRFRPDASTVEVWSRGQVNPFGLCFDRRGNLYSADCHSSPVYQLLQGGWYPSFGKPHDGLGFAPAMIEHSHGSTGICGITYIDRDQWGTEWNDHLLIGNPVTSRINHDIIEFRGTTPVAVEQKDFVISDDLWFRPVDLHHGHDGALYIADFYNRIIGHYEVPLTHPGRDRERGRIWKVTRKGNTRPPREIVAPGKLDDPVASLGDADPFTVRRAAHQLQLQPDQRALTPLLNALDCTPPEDTHLTYVLRLAIRAQLVAFPQGLSADALDPRFLPHLLGVAPAIPSAAAAALLANSPERANHLSHIARHGTPETLRSLISALRANGSADDQLAQLDALQAGLDERGQLDPNPDLLAWAQALATELLQQKQTSGPSTWKALPHPEHPQSESPWTHQPRQCSDGQQANVLSSLRIGEGEVEQRTGMLQSEAFPAPDTLTFWLVGHRGAPDQAPHEKNFVALITADGEEIQRAYPPRSDIAEMITWEIGAGRQGKPVRLQITDGDTGSAYAWLGIARIGGTEAISTDSFQRTSRIDENLSKLAELLKITAPVALRDQLKPYLAKQDGAAVPTPVTPEQRAELDRIIAQRIASFTAAKAAGTLEPEQGAKVFGQNCAACHQIGGLGGLIGPQLDGIGARGIERLSEDILDPNRNVDSHFYLTRFKLKDGTETSGFVLSEKGQSLLIRDLLGNNRRLKLSEIETKETISTSLMPASFGSVIEAEKFASLLAWLVGEH